jgi:hypothetical protein
MLMHSRQAVLLGALVVFLWTSVLCWEGTVAAPEAKGKHPAAVLIIRHAEKPEAVDDVHLSDRGKERASRLHLLFVGSPDRPAPFALPDFLFATHNSDQSHRPLETVTPLAAKLRIPINHRYKNKSTTEDQSGIEDLARELSHNPKYAGKTVLLCWHHGSIPALARALKANNTPEHWPSKAFDRVWRITYDEKGKATFADLPQHLLKGDSRK